MRNIQIQRIHEKEKNHQYQIRLTINYYYTDQSSLGN